MAANINNSAPRFEYARPERDDESNNNESATSDGQTSPPSNTTIAAPTEQQDQSSGDSSGSDTGTHDPSSPPPQTSEAETPLPPPASFRYGLGDVSIGRPDYARAYADRAQRATGEPEIRETAFAPTLRAADTPLPSTIAAPTALPLPKPGGNIASDTAALPPAPEASPAPITNAPHIGGEAVVTPSPSRPNGGSAGNSSPTNRRPELTAGLHTAPEQSPYYANAVAYGREHSYNDDEIMKLAVLMQNNRDQSMGREWLSLKPQVLRAAVNAVVRNADNSFDTSGVFGGQLGYPCVNFQRIPADAATAAYGFSGDGAPQYASVAPEGWILSEQTVESQGSSGDGGEGSTTITLHYYIPDYEINKTDESAYLPLAVAGYMQVPRGYESELSVGAEGGVNDLSALAFDPEYGLITRIDNYRPYDPDDNDWDRFMEIVTIGTISIGTMAVIGPVIAAGAGTSTAGVIAAGAANGVIGSAITTMLQGGEVTFRGLLQAAFSGGMIAGLSTLDSYQALNNLGLDPKNPNIVTSYALRAISITGTSTIRGAIQELIGGRFRDGFTQGVVQGLSGELTRYLNAEITAGLANEQITPAQADALRELTRFTGSALRAAANPNDPMNAFAQDYLQQLLGPQEVPEVRGTAFDDDGNLIPGLVDPNASLEEQQQQLQARLQEQGLPADQALLESSNYFSPAIAERNAQEYERLFVDAEAPPILLASVGQPTGLIRGAEDIVNEIEATFANGGYRSKESIEGSISDAYDAYLRLAKPYDINPSSIPSPLDESRARSLMVALANLGERARDYGITLNPEMERIVRGAQANRANVSLMDTYGNQVGGGTLSARQIQRNSMQRTPSAGNYRDLFRANRPDMPPDYQVHHTLPQKYADRMAAAGINIHEVRYLRGVDDATHREINTLWRTLDRQNNGNPTIAQIQSLARQIDQQFGSKFIWPK